jgi:hypothetical protein
MMAMTLSLSISTLSAQQASANLVLLSVVFLKNSPPTARRRNIWFGAHCTSCIAIIGALVAYTLWSDADIERQLMEDGASNVDVGAVVLRAA